ncbi:MAG: penicillin-binding protein [Clostridiales bacterium]|nr:penicillin-binding protein [Candidatus Crickella caballi]
MRKQERRALICVLIAVVLLAGIGIFVARFVKDGGKWATFYGNSQIYTDGILNRGTVTDRYDEMLLNCTESGVEYNSDATIRKATVHAVGDPKGNISSGAINAFKSQLIGYDIINGTYDTSAEGKKIQLTIDAKANAVAYNALGGRTGCVGVFNWKTGEILSMVSTPSCDPAGSISNDAETSYYFNNFLQGAMTPGSTFKLVTSAAAIDKVDNISSFSFDCDGNNEFKGTKLKDVSSHGHVDFRSALAQSCNGAFGAITRELGAKTMEEYVEKCGLTESIEINGIDTQAGSFKFPDDDDVKLSWAGIGQADDQVNPCAMMVYMGAIANEGEAVHPTLIKSATFVKEITGGRPLGRYLSKDTANELRSMMKNNVESNYGTSNYSGLDIYAKSGTAEVGDRSDSWFVGFIDNEDNPYAFVVWVKGGGFGSSTAGPVAKAVLNQLISDNE